MDLWLAQPRGFCAGVDRAVQTVWAALARFGAPVHVYHQIVHNGQVVAELAAAGAVFVDELAKVPTGSVLVFSAHGVPDAVRQEAAARRLRVIDATCPLVTKVHLQARQYAAEGRHLVIIGHGGHDEVEGTRGSAGAPSHVVASVTDVQALPWAANAPVAYVTQTTLSMDDTRQVIAALAERYADLQGPQLADICYATQNRQAAVRALARRVELVLVVGARNSSNACRLQEVAAAAGVRAKLLATADELDPAWLLPRPGAVGVTAGASTPDSLVQGVCRRLQELGSRPPRVLPGLVERVHFRLPEAQDHTHQRTVNSQAGAPMAMQAVSSTVVRGDTSTRNSRSNVAAK